MRTRSPSLEGPSYAQFAHMLAATYSVCAKGGWGHVRAAGAAAHRGFLALLEGDPVWGAGAPDPRAAGAPFTSMELEKELEGDLRGTNHRDKTNFLRGGLPPEVSRTVGDTRAWCPGA